MRGQTVKSPENVARARVLRAQGWLLREIAAEIGVATATVDAWLNDPDGARLRARKQSYRGVCVRCGGPTSGDRGPSNPHERCRSCSVEAQRAKTIWTREAIVFAIREWASKHDGVPPAVSDSLRVRALGDRSLPPGSLTQRRFGSWNAAIIAAGFEPHALGPVGGFTQLSPEQREAAAQRFADGEPAARIAADFGCAPGTILKWARRTSVGRRAA